MKSIIFIIFIICANVTYGLEIGESDVMVSPKMVQKVHQLGLTLLDNEQQRKLSEITNGIYAGLSSEYVIPTVADRQRDIDNLYLVLSYMTTNLFSNFITSNKDSFKKSATEYYKREINEEDNGREIRKLTDLYHVIQSGINSGIDKSECTRKNDLKKSIEQGISKRIIVITAMMHTAFLRQDVMRLVNAITEDLDETKYKTPEFGENFILDAKYLNDLDLSTDSIASSILLYLDTTLCGN